MGTVRANIIDGGIVALGVAFCAMAADNVMNPETSWQPVSQATLTNSNRYACAMTQIGNPLAAGAQNLRIDQAQLSECMNQKAQAAQSAKNLFSRVFFGVVGSAAIGIGGYGLIATRRRYTPRERALGLDQ